MADDGNIMLEDEAPISAQELYEALEQSTNSVGPQRAEAEARLKQWEASAKAGFVFGLLHIIGSYSLNEVTFTDLCRVYGYHCF